MSREKLESLQDIPNVGVAIERNLVRLGIHRPRDLIGQDPFEMYERLCRITGERCDPCVIDVFMSAVRYMEGEPAQKWWKFTDERKKRMRLE